MMSRILVPTDFGECSRRALEVALELAKKKRARVKLLHVWPFPSYVTPAVAVSIGGRMEPIEALALREAQARRMDFLGSVKNEAKIALDFDIVHGIAEDVILERAENAGLVVMGTHGRSGPAPFVLGSVTEKVLRSCSRPVLVVNNSIPATLLPA